MALSLGTLFVKLNADPSQLSKGMNEAADKVAKFGNKVNEISGKLGGLGVSLTALGAGALRLAGQFDANVKRATDDLSNSFNSIMVEIGRALIPVVQALSNALAIVANWMKSLSPETKQMVAGFAAVAAGSLTLTAGVGKLISVFTALAPVITGALGPIMPILLPIIGVIAAIVAIVPLLWYAWKENFGNVQGFTGAVVDFIADKWKAFKSYFGGVIDFIAKAWNRLVDFLFQAWATQMKAIASAAAGAAKLFGADWSNELSAFNETIDDMASRGFSGMVDDAKDGMAKIAFAWEAGAKDIGSNVKKYIGEAIKGVFGDMNTGLDKLKGLGGKPADGAKPKRDVMVMDEIEVIGRVDEQIEENAKKVSGMSDFITNQVMSVMGDLGTLFQVIEAGMAAGGPWGALAGAIIYLVGRTKEFQVFIQELMGIIDVLSTELGLMLAPLFKGLSIILKALTPVISGFLKLLGGPLFYAFKHLGLMLAAVGIIIAEIGNAFASAFSFMLQFAGNLLNSIMKGSGDSVLALAEYTRSQMIATGELYKMAAELQGLTLADFYNREQMASFPGIGALGDAASQTASTLERLNDALTNVPAGFKVAAARFNATSPNLYLETRSQPLQVDLNLDGKSIYQSIIALDVRKSYVQDGRLRYKPSI
jgi:hypothetical protein